MSGDKKESGAAVLFFPKHGEKDFAMYVSTPPPEWLSERDLTKIVIDTPGIYCLFFLAVSQGSGYAYITVNGREIRGSFTDSLHGKISGSAVCSIRSAAIPCSLGITTGAGAENGILLVVRYDV